MLIVALGNDEALILLQRGEMLRAVVDGNEAWRSATRFLTSSDGAPGMLAVLPRAAARAFLSAPTRHAIERELKELLFDELAKAERPPLSAFAR